MSNKEMNEKNHHLTENQMDKDDTIQVVLSYKSLCQDTSKHKIIIKDKTMVQFLAYSLDSMDEIIVQSSLETLDLLIQNRNNHYDLRNTFGIMESILSASNRVDLSDEIRAYALKLHTSLESSGLSYLQVTPVQQRKQRKSVSSVTLVYTFHVFGLNQEVRCELEDSLVGVRGVVSVVINTVHQRVLVRVIQDGPDVDTLIKAVTNNTCMTPVLVIKNNKGQEFLKTDEVDTGNEEELPNYLPEEESPVKDKALLSFDKIRCNASSWVRSASAFLQDAFYW